MIVVLISLLNKIRGTLQAGRFLLFVVTGKSDVNCVVVAAIMILMTISVVLLGELHLRPPFHFQCRSFFDVGVFITLCCSLVNPKSVILFLFI